MNRNVNAPVVIVALIALVALVYGIYRFENKPGPSTVPGQDQVPPPVAAKDIPPPPPGMHVPGKAR